MNPQDLLSRLPGLAQRWRAQEFDAAILAALYFLHWQIASHGRQFASRKNRGDPRPDANEWLAALEAMRGEGLREQLFAWLERYQFRGVISNVPIAIIHWLRGDWRLILHEDVPKALDVLRMQARGYRVVTALTEYSRLRQPVMNKPNAYVFFLHDLEHAYKFFHSAALCTGQCDFFARLERAFDHGLFLPYFEDAEFTARFQYLMSDMNTHPEHSRQYLRAILVEFHLRYERKEYRVPLSPASERAIEELMHVMAPSVPLTACA